MTPKDKTPNLRTICMVCRDVIANKSPSIECDVCKRVVHALSICSGLNQTIMKGLASNKNLFFKCNTCQVRGADPTSHANDSGLAEGIVRLTESVNNIVANLTQLTNKVNQLTLKQVMFKVIRKPLP